MIKIMYNCLNNLVLISRIFKIGEVYMDSKMKATKNNKKEDNNFKKKNIKHGNEESARVIFEHMEKTD